MATDVAVGRRERKKEETRRRIYEAAFKLFNDKGFDATTVDDIAALADVAKGTFFNYFPRKEAVVHYLFEEWTEAGERVVSQTGRPAEERIIELFVEAAASFGEQRELARTVARFSLQALCAPTPDSVATHRRHHAIFDELWRQGVARGEFRGDLELFRVRGVLGSVFVGAVTWWVGGPHAEVEPESADVPLPEIIRTNLTMVFDGLRAPEGA